MPQRSEPVRVQAMDEFEALRRLMDEFSSFRKMMGARGSDVWMPPTDVFETYEDIVIKMSVPGVKLKDIRILFNGEVMTIGGFRDASPGPEVVAYHQMEIRHGYFERTIVFHKPVNPEAYRWEYQEGFLWIWIPKAEEQVRRVLTIRLEL